ncbi:MAG: hypothetical protein H6677_09405 [Candidatus Obscuribacterales bacterium]|nr:hypothetical protein [Cyanobacteria bacterium HKST-UBA01]MCB9468485.1 hypothetical protein [Candidatus Obscuribacterales bacterium]
MVEHLEAARVQESAPVSEAGKFQSYVEGINSLTPPSKAETGTKDILPGLTITKEGDDMGSVQQVPSDGVSGGRNSMEGPQKAQTFGDTSEKPDIIKNPKPGDKDVPANIGSSTDNSGSDSGDKGDTGNVGGTNDECFQPLLPKGDGKAAQKDIKDLKSLMEENGLEYKPPSNNSDEEFIKEKFRQVHEGSHESVQGDADADSEATNVETPKLKVPDGAMSVEDSIKAEQDWIKQKFDQVRPLDKNSN